MKFKTKIAYTAVLATLGMVAGSAQASFLSETGTGQVLIYPYYTVQSSYDTYISVVNSTSRAKAVKVRFIEAQASREVLDFNLYLSPQDVWTGAVTATADGAQLVTNDKSCTAPMITGPVPFRNGQYTGSQDDVLDDGLGRTREGYLEMIEMGDLGIPVPPVAPAVRGNLAWMVTHAKTGANVGLPNDCDYVNQLWANVGTNNSVQGDELLTAPPSGGLFGSGTLINVSAGTDYSYDPVAIEDFNTLASLHYRPGHNRPSFEDAQPISVVIRAGATAGVRDIVQTDWSGDNNPGVSAVSAVLMHASVMNEYTIETGIHASTDWIVTFPTKSLLNPPAGTPTGSNVTGGVSAHYPPFTNSARTSSTSTEWNACEVVTLKPYDREERSPGGTVDFSPSTSPLSKLCYEANVITFNNTKVFGSKLVEKNVNPGYQNGWMNLTFTAGGIYNSAVGLNKSQQLVAPTGATRFTTSAGVTSTGNATYVGLPVVGFAAERYVNSNVNGVLSNYGGSFVHKYARTIR